MQNVGLNTVSEFTAYLKVYNSSNELIQTYTHHYQSPPQNLVQPGEAVMINFGNFRTNNIGVFRATLSVDLQSAYDMEAFNNNIPRQGDPDYTFEIAYPFECAANAVVKPAPGEHIMASRPITPMGEFRNEGIELAADVPTYFIVRQLPSRDIKYQSTFIAPDIQSGTYNKYTSLFD
ncbi:MAG: Right-handed parallel beta-helix repeat-containing protein, partial [Bacteroidota bacterium]|nr:Right-handed parallel beta-helix repeat-containing protein [Bacteroidota bacterium]